MEAWIVRLGACIGALVGDIVLCSWARHFSFSASLYPGVEMGSREFHAGGNRAMDRHPILERGGGEILLVTSCDKNSR